MRFSLRVALAAAVAAWAAPAVPSAIRAQDALNRNRLDIVTLPHGENAVLFLKYVSNPFHLAAQAAPDGRSCRACLI